MSNHQNNGNNAEVFATCIAAEAQVVEARELAIGQCSFSARLSTTGSEPATHYMGAGVMDADVVEALRSICYVSDEQPSVAMAHLSLMMVVEEL